MHNLVTDQITASRATALKDIRMIVERAPCERNICEIRIMSKEYLASLLTAVRAAILALDKEMKKPMPENLQEYLERIARIEQIIRTQTAEEAKIMEG
jgi:hypothetical protein